MPKGNKDGQLVVDCMNGFHIPREHEAALMKKAMIREPGKSGVEKEQGKIHRPRLYHRPDGRKYVADNGWSGEKPGEGFVTDPRFVNPGKSSIIKLCLEKFWETFDDSHFKGIVGQFNQTPIQNYNGLEKRVSKAKCPLYDGCEHRTCPCVWRPQQILTWGRLIKGQFTALPADEIIRSPWMSMYELRDIIRAEIKGKWIKFRSKPSKKYDDLIATAHTPEEKEEVLDYIAVHKLIDNLHTMQRTSFSVANCYGLALHQFAVALETRYLDDLSTVMVCLAVNERDPVVENLRQAQNRLNGDKPKKKKPKKEEPEDEYDFCDLNSVKVEPVINGIPALVVGGEDDVSPFEEEIYETEGALISEATDESLSFDEDPDNY